MQVAIFTSLTAAVLIFIFQKAFGNIIAGIILLFSKPFKKGDKISVRQNANEIASGKVLSRGIVHTKLKTYTRDVIIIPNIQLLENFTVVNSNYKEGVNYTQTLRVSPDSNIKKIKRLIMEALIESKYTSNTEENTDIVCRFVNGDVTITYNVRSESTDASFVACNDITEMLLNSFNEADDIKIL